MVGSVVQLVVELSATIDTVSSLTRYNSIYSFRFSHLHQHEQKTKHRTIFKGGTTTYGLQKNMFFVLRLFQR
jgi:uncharacterized membrane protein